MTEAHTETPTGAHAGAELEGDTEAEFGPADDLAEREAAAQAATMAAAVLRPGVAGNAAEHSFAASATEDGPVGVAPVGADAGSPDLAERAAAGVQPKRSASARSATAPQASRGERFTSYDVSDFAVPTGREEEWRFTPLLRLRGLHDGTAAPDGKVVIEVDAAPELQVETVGRDDERLGRVGTPGDRVAGQAWSAFERATVLTVPAQVVASRPTVVTTRGEGDAAAAYGHLLIHVRPLAEAVVVLDYAGSATYADNIELQVGDGASLTVVAVHDWADDAVHVTSHAARLGRDARFRSVVVTLGGSVVRVAPAVEYAAPGGDAELLGLYFADAGQHLEHRLFVDHSQPHCRSNVLYKGALQGADAHVVWIGDVLIRAAAEGTDTYELNRNLVLTDGARADSVPNLEIETGEIAGAGHASTTGRFDDEQLFYLQARGIPEAEARRLVVRGFFAELIARINLPEVEARLLTAVEAELHGSSG